MEVGLEGCLDMLMLCCCCLFIFTLKHTHAHTHIHTHTDKHILQGFYNVHNALPSIPSFNQRFPSPLTLSSSKYPYTHVVLRNNLLLIH